jgi:heme/copper-type cytochrome/quinol oxidase subunit 3
MTDYVFGGRREDEVPRTHEARNAGEVADLLRGRLGVPVAWWGMAMLIASEATIVLTLVGTYYYLRIKTLHWPPPGDPTPRVVVPLVLAGVLATTSLPMQLAYLAGRAGRIAATRFFLIVALIVQCGYIAYEMWDYQHELHAGPPLTHDAYESIYYTLLGADHAHVWIGIFLNVWLLAKLVRGMTMYRYNALVAITWYWHFVNVLTLVVIGTLTSAAV